MNEWMKASRIDTVERRKKNYSKCSCSSSEELKPTHVVQAQTHTHLFIYGQTNKVCVCMWTIECILIKKTWSQCNIWLR